MQQPTSRQLYAYWDGIRNGRIAPRRIEIEPAKIAPLSRETFIAECTDLLGFRFRLAGTRICQHFGRERRGVDFLSLWPLADRDAIASLVRNVLNDGAVGYSVFDAYTKMKRQTAFEVHPHAADPHGPGDQSSPRSDYRHWASLLAWQRGFIYFRGSRASSPLARRDSRLHDK